MCKDWNRNLGILEPSTGISPTFISGYRTRNARRIGRRKRMLGPRIVTQANLATGHAHYPGTELSLSPSAGRGEKRSEASHRAAREGESRESRESIAARGSDWS